MDLTPNLATRSNFQRHHSFIRLRLWPSHPRPKPGYARDRNILNVADITAASPGKAGTGRLQSLMRRALGAVSHGENGRLIE